MTSRERGFALLIVLWMLVLISLIIAHVTTAAQSELRIAGNLKANAMAQTAADGAIYHAIFSLADPRPNQRWPADGTSHVLQIGTSRIVVQVEDEGEFINPNLAPAVLLEGLLRAVGVEPGPAADLAEAIREWVGSGKVRRTPEELLAEYRAAGLDYGPPIAPRRSADELGSTTPIESLDELERVRGMNPQVVAALRPHLTLFGQAAVPNSDSTDPVVAAAVQFARAAAAAGVSGPLPELERTNSEFVTARIHATAQGPGNAEVGRVAIVRIGSFAARGYSLLAWGSGAQ